MSPQQEPVWEPPFCFPRVSGDEPDGLPIATLNTTFSPRERG